MLYDSEKKHGRQRSNQYSVSSHCMRAVTTLIPLLVMSYLTNISLESTKSCSNSKARARQAGSRSLRVNLRVRRGVAEGGTPSTLARAAHSEANIQSVKKTWRASLHPSSRKSAREASLGMLPSRFSGGVQPEGFEKSG